MRKVITSMILLSALLFGLSSCGAGEKLLTEEEMALKIEETTTAQIDSLTTVLDEECVQQLAVMVSTKTDSILIEKAIAEEAEGKKK